MGGWFLWGYCHRIAGILSSLKRRQEGVSTACLALHSSHVCPPHLARLANTWLPGKAYYYFLLIKLQPLSRGWLGKSL